LTFEEGEDLENENEESFGSCSRVAIDSWH
jgi:hypothetical protein